MPNSSITHFKTWNTCLTFPGLTGTHRLSPVPGTTHAQGSCPGHGALAQGSLPRHGALADQHVLVGLCCLTHFSCKMLCLHLSVLILDHRTAASLLLGLRHCCPSVSKTLLYIYSWLLVLKPGLSGLLLLGATQPALGLQTQPSPLFHQL